MNIGQVVDVIFSSLTCRLHSVMKIVIDSVSLEWMTYRTMVLNTELKSIKRPLVYVPGDGGVAV